LVEDRKKSQGKWFEDMASSWSQEEIDDNMTSTVILRPNRPLISLHLSHDNLFLYCSFKDRSVGKWDVETQSQVCEFQEKVGNAKKRKRDGVGEECLRIQGSKDGEVAVGAMRGGSVLIWDARDSSKPCATLTGHRDDVTSLTEVDLSSPTMYSGSSDRTVKAWDLRARGYVETLFGHQRFPSFD